jgi:hypothetical protein
MWKAKPARHALTGFVAYSSAQRILKKIRGKIRRFHEPGPSKRRASTLTLPVCCANTFQHLWIRREVLNQKESKKGNIAQEHHRTAKWHDNSLPFAVSLLGYTTRGQSDEWLLQITQADLIGKMTANSAA